MILPMQFVNDVRVGKEIMFCPYCSRILFFQEDGEEVFYQQETPEGIFDMDDIEDEESDFVDDEETDDEDGESDSEDEEAGEEEEEV
jgi:hypothetical protein